MTGVSADVVVTTARLVVRRFTADDAASLHEYRNDLEVARYQGWSLPYSRADAAALVRTMHEQELFALGVWTQLALATRQEPTALIGDIGVRIEPVEPTAEVGFTVARAHWGNGYAAEALTAVVEHLIEQLGLARVVAFTDRRNEQAQRVLERAGLRYITEDDNEFLYYRRAQEVP